MPITTKIPHTELAIAVHEVGHWFYYTASRLGNVVSLEVFPDNTGEFRHNGSSIAPEVERMYNIGRQAWGVQNPIYKAHAAKMVKMLIAGSAAARELTGDGKELDIEGGGSAITQKDLEDAWKYAFVFKRKSEIPAYIVEQYNDVRRFCRGIGGPPILFAAKRLLQRKRMLAEELEALWDEIQAMPVDQTLLSKATNDGWGKLKK